MTKRLTASIMCIIIAVSAAVACTSAIVSASASKSGRPLLWKHRDTSSHENNFIERVESDGKSYGYIALFNAGDSLLAEAWTGVNDVGFAIMNTASYNLAPDTAAYRDREGFVMTEALRRCKTVNDFRILLDRLPRPLGVSTNFGVIDRDGNGAFFETDDYNYTIYDLADAPDGILIRTNYSISGTEGEGLGHIRYKNAEHILSDIIADGKVEPSDFTERISRSFYHSLWDRDMVCDTVRWLADTDFVPRYSSTASVVIEGAAGENCSAVMWAALGYPPCAVVEKIDASHVPASVRQTSRFGSEASARANACKHRAFAKNGGNGSRYIDMDYLRPLIINAHTKSLRNYGQ